ncbi:hypothetical protein EV658_10312 [Phaeovulum veldkampii DSM 11550]|nr:hypothetical protein EV658_10312 [Phaeovulum veldkampii DSM 11550]
MNPKATAVTLRALLALAVLFPVAACGGGGDMRLYPTQGPIADADPSRVIAVSVDKDTDTSGMIKFRLPKPEKARCKGTWTSVAPKIISRERGLSLSLRNPGGEMNRSTEDVGGVNSGEIYAVCNNGARVQGNFIMGSGTESGTGTATDTLGNSYKLLF